MAPYTRPPAVDRALFAQLQGAQLAAYRLSFLLSATTFFSDADRCGHVRDAVLRLYGTLREMPQSVQLQLDVLESYADILRGGSFAMVAGRPPPYVEELYRSCVPGAHDLLARAPAVEFHLPPAAELERRLSEMAAPLAVLQANLGAIVYNDRLVRTKGSGGIFDRARDALSGKRETRGGGQKPGRAMKVSLPDDGEPRRSRPTSARDTGAGEAQMAAKVLWLQRLAYRLSFALAAASFFTFEAQGLPTVQRYLRDKYAALIRSAPQSAALQLEVVRQYTAVLAPASSNFRVTRNDPPPHQEEFYTACLPGVHEILSEGPGAGPGSGGRRVTARTAARVAEVVLKLYGSLGDVLGHKHGRARTKGSEPIFEAAGRAMADAWVSLRGEGYAPSGLPSGITLASLARR